MHQLDPETQAPRGFVLLQRSERPAVAGQGRLAAAATARGELAGWPLAMQWADRLSRPEGGEGGEGGGWGGEGGGGGSEQQRPSSWEGFAEAAIAALPREVADALAALANRCNAGEFVDGRLCSEVAKHTLYPHVAAQLARRWPDVDAVRTSCCGGAADAAGGSGDGDGGAAALNDSGKEEGEAAPLIACASGACQFAAAHVATVLLLGFLKATAAAGGHPAHRPPPPSRWSAMAGVWEGSLPAWSSLLQDEVATIGEMIAGARAISYLANDAGATPPASMVAGARAISYLANDAGATPPASA
ncbi:hypothetical protein JKP88DRAFT_349636 [Tribonema minus]|uniref:Uncharacterized protein n=1 Tax=Tribonema minus TaxID=303371 RepID=A0A835YRY7_9STRA|nr:hypothetical protein JKP88DRAFT_349636 [Tribonema minus]